MQMHDFVIELLKTKIPPTYYYHNYKHTLYVIKKALEIGKHENCTVQELELLSAAALWHDTGYMNTYSGHEEESCVLAKKYMPGFGFINTDIEYLCGMIMATKLPQSPKNKLEQIIADADMAYLGTKNATVIADTLFKEFKSIKPALTSAAWNQQQIKFLQQHHYFTAYCKQKYEPIKSAYLKNLLKKK
jgi:predicted metal-dependent HD superfamily phosphohydrolase